MYSLVSCNFLLEYSFLKQIPSLKATFLQNMLNAFFYSLAASWLGFTSGFPKKINFSIFHFREISWNFNFSNIFKAKILEKNLNLCDSFCKNKDFRRSFYEEENLYNPSEHVKMVRTFLLLWNLLGDICTHVLKNLSKIVKELKRLRNNQFDFLFCEIIFACVNFCTLYCKNVNKFSQKY